MQREKIKIRLLILTVVIHLLISFFTIIPGYLSIDEVTYHLATKNFSESGGFEIRNGYQEYPSLELESAFITARKGRLVSRYPYLYPILCSLFYLIAGFQGLFVINVIAFIGIVILCYVIPQKIFHDSNLALNACFILVLATYAWEYSQAIWSHAATTVFLMTAFYIHLCSFDAKTRQMKLSCALLSGIITGFATGIRYDAIFMLPCFIVSFLFVPPGHPLLALSTSLGTVPGLAMLGATNYIKFGIFSLFSYGGGIEANVGKPDFRNYLPLGIMVSVVVVILWMFSRHANVIKKYLSCYRQGIIILLIVFAVLIAMLPTIWHEVGQRLSGLYQIVVDFRVRSLEIKQPALSRSRGGGMVYIGGLKKSLLQSCPYLVVLLIPLFKIFRRSSIHFWHLYMLFLPPLVYTGFYGYYAWHGGLCLNLRYLFPILPFTSILSAYAWRDLTESLHCRKEHRNPHIFSNSGYLFFILLILNVLMVAVYFSILRPTFTTIDQQEFLYLTLPLILVLCLLTLLVLRHISYSFYELRSVYTCITYSALCLFFMGMVWAGLTAFFYDYLLVRHARQNMLDAAAKTMQVISEDSIIFTTFVDPFFRLIEHRQQIRIANPERDNFHDFPDLIAFHLKEQHSVYGVFSNSQWQQIKTRGLIEPSEFKIIPLKFFSHYTVAKITSKSD